MPSPNLNAQHAVTAVIVAHDGAAWLPHVTEALLNQTRPVDRVVAVDTGSRDRSGAMLAEALGRGAVFGMDRGTGYAAAVHHALRHRAAHANLPPGPGGSSERVEWVWLLHDDCEPEPDALELLLDAAAATPGAAVLGPKVMDWSDREVLLEAGIGIDRAGRRITGIEPREMDQGQHDGDRDVLAVSSAGMLVRRDVWERVGGFDPAMRLYREDVDFCWRAQAAGHRVRVVTDAVVYHVEASARNRRAASAAPRRAMQERRNALLVLCGNLPLRPMLSSLAGNLVLSALRTVFFLLAKRPAAALDESAAYLSVIGHPLRLLAARRQRARGRRAAFSRLRAEILPGRSFRRMAEYAAIALSRSSQPEMVGSHHATDDPSDDDSLLVDSGIVQRALTNPGVLLFLGLTVITLVALRSLLAAAPLSGGALVPAWGGASDLWREFTQGFHPAGVGTAASAPPYVAVLAFIATILAGKPWLAVDVILIGCVPLAGVAAYLAARRVTSFVPARVWAALAYALLPVAMGAVAAGRLGSAVALVLIPFAGMQVARIFTAPRWRARRAAWAAAFVVTVAAAFVPLLWLVAVVAVGLGLLAFGRRQPVSPLNALIVAAVPPLLLAPWSLQLFTHPAQLLLEVGPQPGGLSASGLPARWLLLLSPGGPGLPPWWVSAGLAAVAVIALLAGGRRRLVLAGWGVALTGLVLAAAVSRVLVAPPRGGAAAPVWPGVPLAVAGAGLILAAAAAAESLRGVFGGGRWRSPRGLAALLMSVVAVSAPALAAASWVASGVNGPVHPASGQILPEVVRVAAASGPRPRTLVLREDSSGAIQYEVLRTSDPLVGSTDLATPAPAQHALGVAVAALTAPAGSESGDQGRMLASLGIGYVLAPVPVNASLAGVLDAVAGLRPFSTTSSFELWQVVGPVAQARVVEPNGTVVPVASAATGGAGARVPTAGGTLVLAEPAGGWSATLNGQSLTPLPTPVDGWAQGFHLPSGGGTLSVSYDGLPRDLLVGVEALALLVVAALGLPGARVAGEAEAEAEAMAQAVARQEASRLTRAVGGRQPNGGRSGRRPGPAAADDEAGEIDDEPARAGGAGRARRGLRRGARGGPGQDQPAAPARRQAGRGGRAAAVTGRGRGTAGRDVADVDGRGVHGGPDEAGAPGVAAGRGVPAGPGAAGRGVPGRRGVAGGPGAPGGRGVRGGAGAPGAQGVPDEEDQGSGRRAGGRRAAPVGRGAPPGRGAIPGRGTGREAAGGPPGWADEPARSRPSGPGWSDDTPAPRDGAWEDDPSPPRRPWGRAGAGGNRASGGPDQAPGRRETPRPAARPDWQDARGAGYGPPAERLRRGRTGDDSPAGGGWADPPRDRRSGYDEYSDDRPASRGGPSAADGERGRPRRAGFIPGRSEPGVGRGDQWQADRGRGGQPAGSGARPSRSVPRGRLPGDDATLPPLPPAPRPPARPRRPAPEYRPEDGEPAWEHYPPHESGESDW